MQRTKKRNKAALVLPVLLVGSGILVACIGLSLKAKLKEDGRYGEQMAVAVPFLMMQERDSLKPLQSPITEPSIPSQPPESTPPAVQTEPTEPSEEATEATAPPPVYGEDESWFDDALFIGDSRMVGLSMYARLGQAFPQHLPQPVKGGRAQNVHGHRQVLFLNAAHQAFRQGPVAHVPRTIGTGNHIKDAEGVLGQALRQRRRVPQSGGKLPLYGKAQGQVAVLPAVQGLPGPGHDLRRIAGDLNPEVLEALPPGSLIPVLGLAHEEPVKDRPAPGLQRLRHRLGRLPVGAEGRLQVPLQVPAKPRKKPPLRVVPHRKGDRRRKGDRSRALQIPAAHYGKQRGSILIAYMANLQFHPNNLLGCGRPLT